MLAVAWVLVAQSVAAAGVGAPAAACADGTAHRANVWERAKSPELRRYCDLLASAASKLAGTAPMAAAALEAATQAQAARPREAAPQVLAGRALAALGRNLEAAQSFEAARARDPRAFDDPPALLSFARTLAATGRDADAVRAYQTLLPRSLSLPAPDRAVVAAEAGLEAMRLGPDAIEEAVADLREALRGAQGDTERFVVLVLALALDRADKGTDATTLLAERARGDPSTALSAWARRAAVVPVPPEVSAIVARALEGSDPAAAREQWEDCVKSAPDGPWAAHARAHLVKLATLAALPAQRARPGRPSGR